LRQGQQPKALMKQLQEQNQPVQTCAAWIL
jgi:hypothetical protein